MFNPVKIKEGLHWVGAIDWNLRTFHGFTYSTHNGTTYNSYLLIDDKVALIDGVAAHFFNEWRQRISRVIDPGKIDYFICNHAEPDHSGAIPEMMKLMPKAKIVANQRAKDALLKQYFGTGKHEMLSRDTGVGLGGVQAPLPRGDRERSDRQRGASPYGQENSELKTLLQAKDGEEFSCERWDFQIVKTGDKLSLGKKAISFIEAPMIHWPDSMFDYLEEEGILFSNDAFGQHYASVERFDDEVSLGLIMDENAKYYANILWPLSSVILKKLDEIKKMNIPIKMILTSHGLSWRAHPQEAIDSYINWAKGNGAKKVIIAYDTMYYSTEKMALSILEGILSQGIEARLYRLPVSDMGDIIKDLLYARGLLIGSSVVNNNILPGVEKFLFELKGLHPLNKTASFFGSYGWMKDAAVKSTEESLKDAGIELALPSLNIKYAPDADELKQCFEFGRKFALEVKKN